MTAMVLGHRHGAAFWHLPSWERLGYRAFFFLRTGGVSRAPFRSLNLGFTPGEVVEKVQANRLTAFRAAKLGPAAPVLGQQVHGTRLRVVSLRSQGRGWHCGDDALPGTDGLLTIAPGLPVGVATADCLPVLLAATGKVRAVAAVHVGWRGLAADILTLAVKKLSRQWHIAPSQVRAALGPAIGPQAFVVRGEVLALLRAKYPAAVGEKPRGARTAGFDLWQAAQTQLEKAGVSGKNIAVTRECTASHPARYFSHRRDLGQTGRMLALIQIQVPKGRKNKN
ncbi:MAG: peptidoglycan editing factor PgeF [Candidatus Firestonebacteria bacterium]|nr:peptidoglycan editing factor PgeF [Candidatus Firestonebacteria bacterium]